MIKRASQDPKLVNFDGWYHRHEKPACGSEGILGEGKMTLAERIAQLENEARGLEYMAGEHYTNCRYALSKRLKEQANANWREAESLRLQMLRTGNKLLSE